MLWGFSWLHSGLQIPNSPVPVKMIIPKAKYVLFVNVFQLTEQILVDRHVPIAFGPRSRIDGLKGYQDITQSFPFTIYLKLKHCSGRKIFLISTMCAFNSSGWFLS